MLISPQLVFQPSDRKCLCEHGYETLVGREQDCVKHVYEICEEGTSRNQDGDCLTETGWEEFCRNEVNLKNMIFKTFGDLVSS